MVNINELRFSADKDHIILDASVSDMDYAKNVYISDVIVNTSEQFGDNGPNEEGIKFSFSEERNKIRTTVCGCIREVEEEQIGGEIIENKRIQVNIPIMDPKDIYFIYVITQGEYGIDTPCGEDSNTTMAILYDKEILYRIGIRHINEVEKACSISQDFMDYMIKEKMFRLLIETGSYHKAIEYWKCFAKKATTVHNKPNCNCNE